jgi:hypothetical protein
VVIVVAYLNLFIFIGKQTMVLRDSRPVVISTVLGFLLLRVGKTGLFDASDYKFEEHRGRKHKV